MTGAILGGLAMALPVVYLYSEIADIRDELTASEALIGAYRETHDLDQKTIEDLEDSCGRSFEYEKKLHRLYGLCDETEQRKIDYLRRWMLENNAAISEILVAEYQKHDPSEEGKVALLEHWNWELEHAEVFCAHGWETTGVKATTMRNSNHSTGTYTVPGGISFEATTFFKNDEFFLQSLAHEFAHLAAPDYNHPDENYYEDWVYSFGEAVHDLYSGLTHAEDSLIWIQ